MNVLLIYPTQPKVATKPPLGLMYLASTLREEGHTPKIVEGTCQTVKEQVEKLTIKHFPDFIGITCMTSQYHEIIKMRDYFHKYNFPIIYGGPHASILPKTLFSQKPHFIDFAVVGEGEKTILNIMDDLYNCRVWPLKDQVILGEVINNLDTLPFPARDLIHKKYFRHKRTSILASRGCPFNCSFCQPTLRKIFGSKVRRRTVGNIVEEMLHCNQLYGLSTFEFFDDTFTSDKTWVYKFCDEVEKFYFKFEVLSRVDMVNTEMLKRMKDAGLKRISLGIESGSQKVLNMYGKGTTVQQNLDAVKTCNRLGIKVHGFFMVGALNETETTLEATKQFLQKVDFETIFVTVTMPMPCTRLYSQAEKENRLRSDWRTFDYLGNMTTTGGHSNPDTSVPINLKHLSNQQIVEARYGLLKSFYWQKMKNPLYLLKFIRENGLRYTWTATKNIIWK